MDLVQFEVELDYIIRVELGYNVGCWIHSKIDDLAWDYKLVMNKDNLLSNELDPNIVGINGLSFALL